MTTQTTDERPAAPPATSSAVVIDDASVQFADQLAVDGISLTVPASAVLGIIGPSGSGKTTTIRLLTGALTPTSGRVTVLVRTSNQRGEIVQTLKANLVVPRKATR